MTVGDNWRARLGHDMRSFSEVIVNLPQPHPKQQEFINDKVARKVIKAGFGEAVRPSGSPLWRVSNSSKESGCCTPHRHPISTTASGIW